MGERDLSVQVPSEVYLGFAGEVRCVDAEEIAMKEDILLCSVPLVWVSRGTDEQARAERMCAGPLIGVSWEGTGEARQQGEQL